MQQCTSSAQELRGERGVGCWTWTDCCPGFQYLSVSFSICQQFFVFYGKFQHFSVYVQHCKSAEGEKEGLGVGLGLTVV